VEGWLPVPVEEHAFGALLRSLREAAPLSAPRYVGRDLTWGEWLPRAGPLWHSIGASAKF
jgi:hypothetical protein